MKIVASILALSLFSIDCVFAALDPRETTTQPPPKEVRLRGKANAVHKRVVHPHVTDEAKKPENVNRQDPLVDPQKSKLRGGTRREHHHHARVHDIGHHHKEAHFDKLEQDHLPHSDMHHTVHHHGHKHSYTHDGSSNSRATQHKHQAVTKKQETGGSQTKQEPDNEAPSAPKKTGTLTLTKGTDPTVQDRSYDTVQPKVSAKTQKAKKTIILRSGDNFNQTLFEKLRTSPFDISYDALGYGLEDDEAFPIFNMPTWENVTGVFSAFSKSAAPLIFENAQALLGWENIKAASPAVSGELSQFIEDSNFKGTLIIGKSFGNQGVKHFLGLVLTYYQFGRPKNTLIPLAKIEDFFEEDSEHHFLHPTTRNLEMTALNDLIAQKQYSGHSNHPIFEVRNTRMEKLEDLDAVRFHQLFQVLIRRSFLMSFGYADCLHQDPYALRECLNDAFTNVAKLETSERIALDEEIAARVGEINEVFRSNVSEACISVQGMNSDVSFGTGSCYDLRDLKSFVTSTFK